MAGLLALVIYLEVCSGARVRWLDVLVNNFFHNSLFLLIRRGEECSVENLNLILLFGRVWVIPAIYNFLHLFVNSCYNPDTTEKKNEIKVFYRASLHSISA